MKTWSPKARYCASNWIMALEIWHFQASKCQKVILDVRYPWAEGLMTLEKSHFQDAKIRMSFSRHHIPLMRGSYDSPLIAFSGICNVKKDFHKKSWTLETKESRPAKYPIFRPPKYRICARRVPALSRVSEDQWINAYSGRQYAKQQLHESKIPSIRISQTPEESHFQAAGMANGGSHESGYRCIGDFIKRQETHFQASNMMKSC